MTALRASIAPSANPAAIPAASTQPPWTGMLRDGSRVSMRPIHALDVELERRFIEDPSPQSRRFRFMESMKSPPPARGIESTHSSDAADNEAMRKFADHPHCHHKRDPDDAKLVLYSVDLKTAIG